MVVLPYRRYLTSLPNLLKTSWTCSSFRSNLAPRWTENLMRRESRRELRSPRAPPLVTENRNKTSDRTRPSYLSWSWSLPHPESWRESLLWKDRSCWCWCSRGSWGRSGPWSQWSSQQERRSPGFRWRKCCQTLSSKDCNTRLTTFPSFLPSVSTLPPAFFTSSQATFSLASWCSRLDM